jgi:hypothetical protein
MSRGSQGREENSVDFPCLKQRRSIDGEKKRNQEKTIQSKEIVMSRFT